MNHEWIPGVHYCRWCGVAAYEAGDAQMIRCYGTVGVPHIRGHQAVRRVRQAADAVIASLCAQGFKEVRLRGVDGGGPIWGDGLDDEL